jgi:methylmalonyl-CoA mutase N-terminal domain/subunit
MNSPGHIDMLDETTDLMGSIPGMRGHDGHLQARRDRGRTVQGARRDAARAAELQARVERAAREQAPLMPLFFACVEQDVTLGEICRALRNAWGEHHPPSWI